MRNLLIILLPILLIGCGEPERKASSAEPERNANGGEPEWKARELERKAKVQSLMKQLADESLESRQAAFAELRDTYIRKRDMSDLNKEIDRNPNSEGTRFLRRLTTYMEGRWRLPDKGWTDDRDELLSPYFDKAKSCESTMFVLDNMRPRPAPVLQMRVFFPDTAERSREIIDLILTLEPETLSLIGGWKDVAFLGLLTYLQELILEDSKVDNLMSVKGLPNLQVMELKNTKVTDITPLKEMPNMRLLYLESGEAIDLTPLNGTSIHILKDGTVIKPSIKKGSSAKSVGGFGFWKVA